VNVYETALGCVVNDDLEKEWEGYLKQTKRQWKFCKPCSRY
jgi:hypothetical protein